MDSLPPAPDDGLGRPVLVAVRDPDGHDAALRFSAQQAARDGRPLLLVHVVNLAEERLAPGQLLLGTRDAEIHVEGLLGSWVERARSLTRGRVPVDCCLRLGPVVSELVDLGSTADRIVLQRRQDAQLRHVLTGSVTAGVASRAPVPVLSVPETWSGTGQVTRLAAAVDGTGRQRGGRRVGLP